MAQKTKLVLNRAKQIHYLLEHKEAIEKKLQSLSGVTAFKDNTLSLMHSPMFREVFGDEILAAYSAQLNNTIIIDFDRHPQEFMKSYTRLMKFTPPSGNISGKSAYVSVFKERGYTVVTDKTKVFGRTGQFTEICKYFKDYFLDLEEDIYRNTATKASSNIMACNISLLTAKGIDVTKDFFKKEVQDVDEDLRFKVLFKPTELGGEIVVKLPRGAKVNMEKPNGKKVEKGINIDYTIIGKNYGKTVMNGCTVTTLSSYLDSVDKRLILTDVYDNNREYEYLCVAFSLVSQIEDFASRKNTHLFMDYIKFSTGASTAGFDFASPNDRVLGSQLVVGTKLKDLEKLAITGEGGAGFHAGMLVAGAGSGKTVLYNTLIPQVIALNNKPYNFKGKTYSNNGNGAVVLLDCKLGEWTAGWINAFKSIGKKLYAFDGSRIDPSLLKYKLDKGKDKGSVANINTPIEMYVAGTYFVTYLRYVIRQIYNTPNKQDESLKINSTTMFNKGNFNVEGITKLPRVFIFVDELTSMAKNHNFVGALKANLLIARDTRTTNMAWLLGGQDLSNRIIDNSETSNYNYKILGNLAGMTENDKAKNRYTYYGATVPEEIIEYTQHNPGKSLMVQGTFLANNTLVKSLFLPEDQNTEALQTVYSKFGAHGMDELEKVVRYAIKHKMFTSARPVKVEGYDEAFKNNNILVAGLRQLGMITDEEYEQMTRECLGLDSIELSGDNTETTQQENINLNFDDAAPVKKSKTTKGAKIIGQNEMPTTAGEALFFGNRLKDTKNLNPDVVKKNIIQHRISPDVDLGINDTTGFKTLLAEKSPYYAERLLKSTWGNVLRESASVFGGLSKITLVEILGPNLFINKRLIDLSNIVENDMYGISDKVSFYELLDYNVLFSKCRALKQLTVDTQALRKLFNQCGSNLADVFAKAKRLDSITILYRGSGEKKVIYRSDANMSDVKQNTKERVGREKLRSSIKKNRVSSFGEDIKNLGNHVIGHNYCVGAYKRSYKNVRKKGIMPKISSAMWFTAGSAFAVGGVALTTGSYLFKKIFNSVLD